MDQMDNWLKMGQWNPEMVVEDEKQCEQDMRYLRSCYPKKAKDMVSILCETCDQMEYENSPMLISVPDKETMYQLVDRMYEEMKQVGMRKEEPFLFAPTQMSMEQMKESMEKELLFVMLCDEMHRRRMRYCRRNQLFSSN